MAPVSKCTLLIAMEWLEREKEREKNLPVFATRVVLCRHDERVVCGNARSTLEARSRYTSMNASNVRLQGSFCLTSVRKGRHVYEEETRARHCLYTAFCDTYSISVTAA